MRYFNGFCLRDESELFSAYIDVSDFSVLGFSYGAQKAFDYASTCNDRIDKLQLISPAFFMDKNEKYKKLQTISFRKDAKTYSQNFLKNITNRDISKYFEQESVEELKNLLYYEWDIEKLRELKKKGVEIEVYLGGKDKIIDPLHVKDFFQEVATIYYIKNADHILEEVL